MKTVLLDVLFNRRPPSDPIRRALRSGLQSNPAV
jgi:hypothetical protein